MSRTDFDKDTHAMLVASMGRRMRIIAAARQARGDSIGEEQVKDAVTLAAAWVTLAANRGVTIADLDHHGDIAVTALDAVAASHRRRARNVHDFQPAVERVLDASGRSE